MQHPNFDLQKLQMSDNDEWTLFTGYFTHRITRYVATVMQLPQFAEDVAANAIADIYVARQMFQSSEHMIAHMFSIARYECLAIYKGHGNFIMSESLLEHLDQQGEQPESLEERKIHEQRSDQYIHKICDYARRLPPRWRELVLGYLRCGRDELRRHLRERARTNGNKEQSRIFEVLRAMVETQEISEKVLEDIRQAVRSFSAGQRSVFLAAMDGLDREQIASKLGVTSNSVHKSMQRCRQRLYRVWKDPLMAPHSRAIFSVRSIKDPLIVQVLREELSRDVPGPACLALASVLKMRKLYQAGSHTVNALAALFHVPPAQVWAIIENKNLTVSGRVVYLAG